MSKLLPARVKQFQGSLLLFAISGLVLGTMILRAQDDNGAAPSPPQVYQNAPAAQDENAPAPDDGSDVPTGSDESTGSVTFQTFYDALGNLGTWIQTNDYGYVWQPQVNDPDWAPYTVGHWVYSDDGWTWVSDEPWGWATYHYGRWVNLDGTGWVWLPGYVWAPAWVSWRYGDGYCGWAPLPPDSFVGVDYSDDGSDVGDGFHIGGDCDGFYGIGAAWYNFVPVSCLGYRSYRGYYCHRGDNYAIINHTTNVTNINVASGRHTPGDASTPGFGRVTAGGPMLAQVNAVSSSPVQRVNLVHAHEPNGGARLTGNSLAVYAPRINAGVAAQPANVTASINQATINRGSDIMRPLAVNSRLGGSAATEAQVQNARVAEEHAPANAKVMMDSSSVRPVLQGPLTALRPVTSETAPGRVYNGSPSVYSNPERAPSSIQVVPTVRAYPQGNYPYPQVDREPETQSRVYYPGQVYPSQPSSTFQQHYPTPGSETQNRTLVRPSTPVEGERSENHSAERPATPTIVSPSAPSAPAMQTMPGRSYPSGGTVTQPASNGGGGGERGGGSAGRGGQGH
jgi:hypothetical protein